MTVMEQRGAYRPTPPPAWQPRTDPAPLLPDALPYRVLQARGGQEVPRDEFLALLGKAPAVCLGERHPNPHDHWLQLDLWKELAVDGVARPWLVENLT